MRAVLDFYGGKYYADPTWHTPSPFFASALDYPESLAEKIFEGPQVSAAIPSAGADEVSARDAWLSNAFKSVKIGHCETRSHRVDSARVWSATLNV